jgi:tRNA threonylcarbamoyladenosine biosynthesis protein TsaE
MATFISHSPAETETLGEKFGRAAQSGFVFALSGDLGAGKTQFVKGLARGLGISAHVHSPTLVNEYDGGRLKLFHLDLYRLETPAQILSAGVGEFLSPDGVSVIEWAERVANEELRMKNEKTKEKIIFVSIEIISESERKIIYDDFGA